MILISQYIYIYVEGNFIIIKFACKTINQFCSSIYSRGSFPEIILGVINNVVMFNVFILLRVNCSFKYSRDCR